MNGNSILLFLSESSLIFYLLQPTVNLTHELTLVCTAAINVPEDQSFQYTQYILYCLISMTSWNGRQYHLQYYTVVKQSKLFVFWLYINNSELTARVNIRRKQYHTSSHCWVRFNIPLNTLQVTQINSSTSQMWSTLTQRKLHRIFHIIIHPRTAKLLCIIHISTVH